MLNGKKLITMDGRNVVFSVVQDRYVADRQSRETDRFIEARVYCRHRFSSFIGLCEELFLDMNHRANMTTPHHQQHSVDIHI